MKAPLKRSVMAGRFLAGAGMVVTVAFWLPMVRGCGAEVSAYQATQVNKVFWLYMLAGVALIACGLALFKLAKLALLYIASAAAAVPFLHLLYKSFIELTEGGEIEPLVGYWLMLFSLGFGTIFPWFARRSMAQDAQPGTATASGGRVNVTFEGDPDDDEDWRGAGRAKTATSSGGKVNVTFDGDPDDDEEW